MEGFKIKKLKRRANVIGQVRSKWTVHTAEGQNEMSWSSQRRTVTNCQLWETNTNVFNTIKIQQYRPQGLEHLKGGTTRQWHSKFGVHVTVQQCDELLVIKPTRCSDFWNLFLEWNSTCFGQFLCPSSGVFHCTHCNGVRHTGLLTACEQVRMIPLASCQHNLYILLCVQWKTPDDGQRNCPKHVEFHSKIKKLRN